MSQPRGKLYLLPVPLGEEDAAHTIPEYVKERMSGLRFFIAERARTGRRFVKQLLPQADISILDFKEWNKRTVEEGIRHLLEPALSGNDIGLMTEAGCPGVADPGAPVVEVAHQMGIEVVPMVGPSSILLALMASGMNGQSFVFHGYLPVKQPERIKRLKQLEQQSTKFNQTQIFIETPYRNKALLEDMIKQLSPSTRCCVAVDLTLPSEMIISQPVHIWRKAKSSDIHKRLAIFLLYSGKVQL